MNFQQAVTSVLSKYMTFSGRASRSEYWWFALFHLICQAVLRIADFALFDMVTMRDGPLAFIFTFLIFLPAISVQVRRLHDVNRSGWWVLIGLIPVVGFLLLLYWSVQRGTEADNEYGPDPLATLNSLSPEQSSGIPRVPRD